MDNLEEGQWEKVQLIDKPSYSCPDILLAELYGRRLCIGNIGEEWFGFSPVCPHAGGELVEGELDKKGNVLCPIHGYTFNIKTGVNTSGEGYYLMHWPVKKREDGFYLKVG